MMGLLLAIVAVLCSCSLVWSAETALTFNLMKSDMTCFHEEVEKLAVLDVEFQVVSGGELDINFLVYDPAGKLIEEYENVNDGEFDYTATAEGEYLYCFSNIKRSSADKWVFFDAGVNRAADYQKWSKVEGAIKDTQEDQKQKKVIESIDKIKVSLREAIHTQSYLQKREVRHRKTAENTNGRVQFWSALHTIIMVSVAVGQVFFIRRFFSNQQQPKSVKGSGLSI
eukprot:Clim_evm24s151 gene=Clim_evmTU24s151